MFFAEAQIRVHLYGQPTDMRNELVVLLRDLREERGGQIPQLLCVHLCHIVRQLHGRGSCHKRRHDDSRICLKSAIKY